MIVIKKGINNIKSNLVLNNSYENKRYKSRLTTKDNKVRYFFKYQIIFRACDKIESVHKDKRPFGLNKLETIKVSFYSLYQSLQDFKYQFIIIGDDLSKELQDFFEQFNDVTVDNCKLGSAAKSLQKQIDLALEVPDNEWIYMCEDDYLHSSYSFKFLSEFIENKEKYLQTSGKKKKLY